jgi:hypothetical protein
LRRVWLGIATKMRFPRIWAVLHRWFPNEHSNFLKSAAYAIPSAVWRRRGPLLAHCVFENAVIHEFIVECMHDRPPYKKECQEKTLQPSPEDGPVLGIQPCVASLTGFDFCPRGYARHCRSTRR